MNPIQCISREATLHVSLVFILLFATCTSTAAANVIATTPSPSSRSDNGWLDIVTKDACFVGLSFPSLREQDGDVQVFTGVSEGNGIQMALCVATLYYYFDPVTGAMDTTENYIRHNGTFISHNDSSPECANGLGFGGPYQEEVVSNGRLMRVDVYTYCCKSILTTIKNKRPTVCNTPEEIKAAIENANAQSRK